VRIFYSINSQWEKFLEVLIERHQEKLIDSIEKKLEDFIGFLTHFKDATDELEASNVPTLYLTILWKLTLLTLLKTKPDDAEFVRNLKKKAKPLLMDKWTITITHKLNTFLHPKYKGLTFLNGAEKEEVEAEARRLISMKSPLRDKED
jgi:hypothetical protein